MGATADRETMQAVVWPSYGSPDVLHVEDVPKPEPTHDQVLVQVAAASVNRADLDYLRGWPLFGRLFTGLRRSRTGRLGLDVAGRVEAAGPKATTFRPGDEVYGNMTAYGFGAFAEYVCGREKAFALKPSTMTMEAAATLPEAAIVALQGPPPPQRTDNQGWTWTQGTPRGTSSSPWRSRTSRGERRRDRGWAT